MNTVDEIAALELQRALPKGAWRLIILEFWERFSYYGILSILVLFLTGPAAAGGFGWSDSRALDLLAKFTAGAFMLPTLGGYVADRWIGARRAVLIGAWLLVVGNVAMAAAALWPTLAPHSGAAGAERALYIGLISVALGNGLFKSSLITLLGELVPADDVARDRAFRRYYQSIMLGALAATLCIGSLAAAVGWWSGVMLAAIGMIVSWAIFVTSPAPVSGVRQDTAVHQPAAPAAAAERMQAHAVVDLAILFAFLPVIAVAWVQMQGLWLLEMERWADRTVATFILPTSWLIAVNGISLVVLIPLAGRWWRRLGRPGHPPPGFAAQLAVAMAMMGVAHLVMALAFRNPMPGGVSLLWPVACVLIITIAEAIFWPSSYNAVHRIAPDRLKSMLMGLWLAMLGIGQFLAHQVARLAEVLGFATLSAYIGAAMLAGCVALATIAQLRPTLRRV